jgi:RNA polymerase sigma-32 factor
MSYSRPSDHAAPGGLNHYVSEVRRYPMLTAGDEGELARRWRDKRDRLASERLVTSHLRLVARIARSFLGYGLPLEDLIAEGNQGLLRSIDRFDPDAGFRLSTYATWWIRAAIQEYILRSYSLVKMGTTAAQKKLFFNLRRLKGEMEEFEGGDLAPESVAKIAAHLRVTPDEVISMNRRLGGRDYSLNVPIGVEGDDEWQDWLTDDTEDQESRYGEHEERTQRRHKLLAALETLSERERHIIAMRRLRDRPVTLDILSREFGVSRERVRQIEVKAIEKLRRSIRACDISRPAQDPS